RRRPRAALPRALLAQGSAERRRSALPHESRDGRELRPRPARAERLLRAVRSRDGRADPGALAALARARSDQPRRALCAQLAHAARHIRRLRLARSVPHSLRQPALVATAHGTWRGAPLRGVRRHALRHRLPHGREPAVSRARCFLTAYPKVEALLARCLLRQLGLPLGMEL